MEAKITAQDMERYLTQRYCDSYEWVFLTQVRSSTGTANRIADAMAFNMYGSTGYEVIGFEIKVSRSDWLSELKQMGKSNDLMQYCDKWFLVVSDASIVKDDELPKNWGLLVLKGDKLVIKTKPIRQKPVQMPIHFIASVLRRNSNVIDTLKKSYVHRDSIEDEINKARQNGYEDARGYNGKQTEQNLKELREQVQVFEQVTGIQFSRWNSTDFPITLGKYVKKALELSGRSFEYDIQNMEQAQKSLTVAIADVRKMKKEFENPELIPHAK